jgi:hypothetical protein
MDEMATKDVMEDLFGLAEADNSEEQGLVKYREEGGLFSTLKVGRLRPGNP